MVETQVTTMEIKVGDLGCEKCRKKIKKLLCKIPQIQSQIYAEKENTVTITVACCSPEKIKRKILDKGCGFIECVVIKPPKPEVSPTPTKPEVSGTKPEGSPTKPEVSGTKPEGSPTKPEGSPTKPEVSGTKPTPPPIKHEVNVTIQSKCCNECNEGSSGPWCHCYSMPPPPCRVPCRRPLWEDGCCSCRRRGYLGCRCEFICEDHSSSCTPM